MSQEVINAATRLRQYSRLIVEIPIKSPEAIIRSNVIAYSKVYEGTPYSRVEDTLLVTEYILDEYETELDVLESQNDAGT